MPAQRHAAQYGAGAFGLGKCLLEEDTHRFQPEHPEADERPPPEVGVVQPVAALHQQQGFGHGDNKQKQAEFITEAAKSRPAQQQRHRRHKGQGAE